MPQNSAISKLSSLIHFHATASTPIPAIIPVSKTTWWDGVKKGRYPQPVKLSPHTTAWKVTEIRDLVQELSGEMEGA